MQEVLHALWQEVLHSPQPPFTALFVRSLVFSVFTCFIVLLLFDITMITARLYHFCAVYAKVNCFICHIEILHQLLVAKGSKELLLILIAVG